MKTLLDIVNLSIDFLEGKGVHNPRREAQNLICDVLKIRPLDLYMQFDRPMNDAELDQCRIYIQRRGKGEPYQYILGEMEFFHCKLNVNPDVLIPRQETEILVDMIAKQIEKEGSQDKILWDVCSGSGCIGISLKKKIPDLRVILSDISEKALNIAKQNAIKNDVDVEFRQGDFLAPFSGEKAHFIVCNPPYVSEEEFEDLDIEVRGFEPKIALVAADQGLQFYKRMAQGIPDVLQPGGKVWLEIGHEQGTDVLGIFKPIHSKRSEIRPDWSGKDRFFFLEIE